MSLKTVLAEQNGWAKISGKPALDLDKASDRRKLAEIIDNKLSPENLSCDGERSFKAQEVIRMQLTKAALELKRLDPKLKFYEVSV